MPSYVFQRPIEFVKKAYSDIMSFVTKEAYRPLPVYGQKAERQTVERTKGRK